MFPLDTVKTRMQAVPHGGASIAHAMNYGTMRAAVSTVLRQEGLRGLYRGVNAMALGAGPAHAFYFATYEVRRVPGGAACAARLRRPCGDAARGGCRSRSAGSPPECSCACCCAAADSARALVCGAGGEEGAACRHARPPPGVDGGGRRVRHGGGGRDLHAAGHGEAAAADRQLAVHRHAQLRDAHAARRGLASLLPIMCVAAAAFSGRFARLAPCCGGLTRCCAAFDAL